MGEPPLQSEDDPSEIDSEKPSSQVKEDETIRKHDFGCCNPCCDPICLVCEWMTSHYLGLLCLLVSLAAIIGINFQEFHIDTKFIVCTYLAGVAFCSLATLTCERGKLYYIFQKEPLPSEILTRRPKTETPPFGIGTSSGESDNTPTRAVETPNSSLDSPQEAAVDSADPKELTSQIPTPIPSLSNTPSATG